MLERDLHRALCARGPEVLSELDGCFALAWHDTLRNAFWLSRDAFGIEPLHYALGHRWVVFASRLPRLRAWLQAPPALDTGALEDYLIYGYCPGTSTLTKDVLRVPGGEALCFVADAGRVVQTQATRWHRLSFRHQPLVDDDAIAEGFRDTLRAAVAKRLGEGRPAVMLSGGMDSSAVVSLMRSLGAGEIRTYTFRCAGRDVDESSYARTLADALGTRHRELELGPHQALDFADAVASMDCPFSDAGIELGTWLVARAAKDEADYVLTGDSGDELWASHPVYAAERLVRFYDAAPVPLAVRRALRRLLDRLPDSRRKRDLLVIAKRLLPNPELPRALRHFRWRLHHDAYGLAELLQTAPQGERVYRTALQAFAGFDGDARSPDAMLYNDYKSAVSFYASRLMFFRHFGVEVRLPFLDLGLVELGAKIPFAKKLEGVERTKRLFRRAMRGVVPGPILDRGDKLGHSVPMKNWLRSNEPLCARVTGVVLEELATRRALVRRAPVERLLAEHRSCRHNHAHRIWSLYVLELWLQQHLDLARPRERTEHAQPAVRIA